MGATHQVTNQVPPLTGHDVAADDALLEALDREGGGWAAEQVHELGRLAGSAQAQEWGRLANEHEPRLRTHDRYGHRIDEVEFHPAFHQLMTVAVGHGLHAAPWSEQRPGAHVARAAKCFVWNQVEAGHGCPISMTYAVIPALRVQPELAAGYEPGLTSRRYDPASAPAADKAGLLAGMSMTEKQGGSDVRANTTRAERTADGSYRLTGHKWFTSAPMCDLFLVLAQAPDGLTCFLLPRISPDGSRNAMRLQRLKDKLGNRSNASAEVEYDRALAYRVGAEGDGIRTIIEMVTMTRLDCVIGSAGGMRAAVSQASHHAAHRQAFGRTLLDQPLMGNVLADLEVEAEAATLLALRLAGATDRGETELTRLALAVGKYWVCKRAPGVAAEALECLGGNGYVEDSGLPRLYREAPLNSLWEGSGNVNALDVLRALLRSPGSLEAVRAEIALAGGADRRLDRAVTDLDRELADPQAVEVRARRLVERLALTLQGSLLVRHGHPAVADAFCASRLGGDWGHAFGTLPTGIDTPSIVARGLPTIG
jgi:putative acyl-CoA dehydrogenase